MMNNMDKKYAMILLIAVVIAIIVLIMYAKANGNSDEKTIKCIAEKSKLIVSRTCHVCAAQEEIFGNYLDYFEILYIEEHPEFFSQYGITAVPTWIIDGKIYEGYKSIEKLKEITGC